MCLSKQSFPRTRSLVVSVPSIGPSSMKPDPTPVNPSSDSPLIAPPSAAIKPQKTPELSIVPRLDPSSENHPVSKPIEHLASIQIEIAKFSRSITPTYRYSPFSFTNPLTKMDSLHSNPTGEIDEDSFFTDILPEQLMLPPHSPLPPISLNYSTTIEPKPTEAKRVPDANSVTGPPIELQPTAGTLVHPAVSTRSDENPPEVIHLSDSLSVSIVSPPPNNSVQIPVIPPSTRLKQPDGTTATHQKEPDQPPTSKVPDDSLFEPSAPSIPNLHLPINDVPEKPQVPLVLLIKKSAPRPRQHRNDCVTSSSTDSSKLRKLAFSVGDGLKWQDTSLE